MNNHPYYKISKTALIGCGFLCATYTVLAQNDEEEEVFELSPFTIDAAGDSGYYASQTMAGGRLSGSLKDTGAAIQVVTKEFMDDIGATGIEELLQYTTSSEVAGILGNFTGANEGGQGETSTGGARREPDGTSRIRGLAAPDRTRNFFVTDIPFDSYNTERIDINRGANSFLFGLGSPAGLINNGMAKAQFRDSNEISTRIGSGGKDPSYRASFKINRVILEDKLAIRVNGLMDRTQYRQRPTYKDDDRLYTAFTYRPFGNENTVLSGFMEKGEILGNSPDVLLPQDNLSSFLNLPARQNASARVRDFRNPFGTRHHEGPNNNQWNNANQWPEDEKAAYLAAGYIRRDEGGVLQYRNIRWGAGAYGFVWDGSNGLDQPAFGYTDQYRGADIERNPNGDAVPNYWSGGPTTGNIRGGTGGNNGGAPQGLYPGNRGEINGTGWLDQGFLDLETFDFSRNNLGWDNDFYTRDFFNYNFSLTQSFWEGKGGFEIAYDYQDLYRNNYTAFNAANSAITFDVNETLLLPADPNYATSGNFDPLPNPNFGRPVIMTKSGSTTIDEQREAFRFTGFVKYDFADTMNNDSLAKVLGNHTLTILADENVYNENRVNWTQDSYGDPDPALHIGVPNGRFSANNVRNIPNLVYIGPPQLDAFNPGFQLSDFELNPARYDLRSTLGNTYQKLSWNRGPDATNDALIRSLDVSNGDEQWLTHTYTPTKVPTKNVRLQQTTITSLAANTQSKILDNLLVVNMGYREDTIDNQLNTEPRLLGINEVSDVSPEGWLLEEGTSITKKESTFGYGGVLYWPKDMISLPEAFDDITFHYNTSENFIPATDRVDELRNPVASPTGSSKDYGISFYMWDNKFVARINWYEAVLAGATAPTSNSYNQNISGMFTHWGQLNRSIKDLDSAPGEAGDRMVDEAWLTDQFEYVPGDTPFTGEVPGMDVDGEVTPAISYADLVAQEYPFLNEVYDARASVAPFLTDPLKVAYNFSERANGQSVTQWAGQITDTQDIAAEGLEAEFIINPTKNWRIAFNAAKQQTVLTNFAPRLEKILEGFWIPHLEQYGGLDWNAPAEPVNGVTTLENRNGFLLDYFALKGNEGKPNSEQREWRFNLVTNYTFREGKLNGFSFGGAARWQDEYAGGYPSIEDPNSVLILPDVANPWIVESDLAIDLSFGYRKKILDNVDWRMQVNLRNVDNWDNADLEFTRYQPDGSPARARYSPPRQILLTNTFRF